MLKKKKKRERTEGRILRIFKYPFQLLPKNLAEGQEKLKQ